MSIEITFFGKQATITFITENGFTIHRVKSLDALVYMSRQGEAWEWNFLKDGTVQVVWTMS